MLRSPLGPPLRPLARKVTEAGGGGPQIATLLTVACGNSISAASQYLYAGSSGWTYKGELQVANILAGGAMRFALMTASTRMDRYGVYAYSGQTLATINADVSAQWHTPIQTAGVTPQLAIGLALLENDIAGGASVADMQARLDAWISATQAAWPSAKILLCTPRPSYSYNTGTLVANYQAMRDYTLGKDNGSTIYVARLDGYEDPGAPGVPLAGYTDATVHPNAKGAMVNARRIAATLRRLGRAVESLTVSSVNRTLTGSATASGTNVTGTLPTGCAAPGSVNGAYVSTALQPGWRMDVSTPTPGDKLDIGTFNMGVNPASAPAAVSPFCKVRIVSGAEFLRNVQLEPRIADGGGNTFRYHLAMQTADVDPEYQNGDVLTFVCPPMPPNSGTITQVMNYVRPMMKNTSGHCVLEVIESGFYIAA